MTHLAPGNPTKGMPTVTAPVENDGYKRGRDRGLPDLRTADQLRREEGKLLFGAAEGAVQHQASPRAHPGAQHERDLLVGG